MSKQKTKEYGYSKLKSKVETTPSKRYMNTVKKVNTMDDIRKLKKMIYNRNYSIKKKFLKDHPETLNLAVPHINDIRYVQPSTFKRLNAIKNPEDLLAALRSVIIDNTRRSNRPKSIGDYSNREMDYLSNGIESLKFAINSWGDSDIIKRKVEPALDGISMVDMNNVFSSVPSYWAISEGYYYATTDFNAFMTEIFELIEREKLPNGQPKYKLTPMEKEAMEDRLYTYRPTRH